MKNIKVAEVEKSWCKKDYNGDYKAMIRAGDALIWTDDNIQHAMNSPIPGRETPKISNFDLLMDHIELNRRFCWFYDMANQTLI